jgi:hypothetical protein
MDRFRKQNFYIFEKNKKFCFRNRFAEASIRPSYLLLVTTLFLFVTLLKKNRNTLIINFLDAQLILNS